MDNFRGSLFMVLAMACFSVEDSFIKSAAKTLSLGEILFVFGFFGTSIFILLTRHRGEKIFHPAILSRAILIRAISEIIGRLFFSISIILIPLTSLSAILQASPLLVIMGAAIFFKEKVGWKRWTAIIVGFIGVLMIIRPGLDAFQPASLFAVLGTLGFAGRDLATRAAPKVLSNIQLGVYGFFVLIPVGLVILFFDKNYMGPEWPTLITSAKLLGIIIFGSAAYYALTVAMRLGEISVVTPFRYTRMLFALFIGIFIFSERPDTLTICGSIIIISSGIYTLFRNKSSTN